MGNNKHIVIVRTSGTYLDYKTYNCQELGLAKALANRGWKVSLVMAGYKQCREIVNMDNCDVEVYYLKFKGINQQLSIFFGWKELLTELKPDIIQVHDMGIYMTYRIAKWAKKDGIPCVMIQGNYQTTQKPLFKQLELMYNATLGRKAVKMVSAVGYKTLQAERYVKRYVDVKTIPTPIGLDDSRFLNIENKEQCWIDKLGLNGKKVLLYVGSIEKRRNPDFLLKVLSILPDDYILLMVGSGAMLEQVKMLCHEQNMDNRCKFLGKLGQDDLPSIYKIASLFLLASSYEIYGMVIMEAMYFGLPVVSSLTAGSETLIKNGVDGIIIPKFEEKGWADAIKKIIIEEQIDKMRQNAQRKVCNELLWDKAVINFENLYKYALTKTKR